MVHEIGHWVYFNMLDDADRIEFWGAMQKYYNEEGLDVNALTKRADILGDGGRKSNTLLSPQKFANQFTLWASRSGMVPNLSLWDKIARMGAKLLDMITGKNQLDLDPDLVPLFQEAIPPLGIDPVTGVSNQLVLFAHLAKFGKEYGKDGGNKAYVFGKAMNDLDIMRHDLMSAVGTSSYAASDATALAETLKTVGRRMYGMVGGKRNDTHHPTLAVQRLLLMQTVAHVTLNKVTLDSVFWHKCLHTSSSKPNTLSMTTWTLSKKQALCVKQRTAYSAA